MKVSNPIRWGFDWRTSTIPALQTETGRRIWGAIKSNHIVDQHFNDNVMAFVDHINKHPPATLKEFHSIACRFGLGIFGTTCERSHLFNFPSPDMEWWGDLFRFVLGELDIEMIHPKPPEQAVQTQPQEQKR